MRDNTAELSEWSSESSAITRAGVGIDLRRLFRLRIRLMIAVFVVLAIPAAVAVFLLVPKQFVAYAEVEFNAEVPRILSDGSGRPVLDQRYDSFVNTQIKMITGGAILGKVLEDPNVNQLPTLQGEKAMKRLKDNIGAEVLPNTELVELSFRDTDREASLSILQAVLDAYMASFAENTLEQGGVRRETLAKSAATLEQDIAAIQVAVLAKRKEMGVPAGSEPGAEPTETESYRINLAQAEADLVTAQTVLRQKERDIERVEGLMARNQSSPQDAIYELGVEDIVNREPAVVALTTQLTAVQQEFSIYQDRYVESAPQLQVKRNERDALEEKLQDVRGQARASALGSLRVQFDYDLTAAQAELQATQDRRDKFYGLLDEYREHSLSLSSGMAEVAEMERQLIALRAELGNVQEQLRSSGIEENAPARIRITSEPDASTNPDQRRRLRFLIAAWFACGCVAAGAGVLKEWSDQRIRSAEDIRFVTDLPVIANVPHVNEDRVPQGTAAETVSEHFPGSMIADEFRRAVGRVLYSPRGRRSVKTCVIASASRGDGKTTLSCNLAIVLAQADRRVLLVDVDSRNPSVERGFGLSRGPGLAEMLRGETLDHDPDRVTQYPTLHVLGPGLDCGDLMERLASREMGEFLDGAEDLFDHIIIDTPASLLMAEARLLAPQVDGVLVVAGAEVSTFGMLRRCLGSMEESGGHVLGIVLNGLRQSPGGYLRENLEMFYRQGKPSVSVGTQGRVGRAAEPSIILVRDTDETAPRR